MRKLQKLRENEKRGENKNKYGRELVNKEVKD